MMTVKQVSQLTGVSIRTLHHYDQIGLLPASGHTESGYRLYDEAALERLQQILLFRALEFSLKDIRRILQSPDFDRQEALRQQITLLTLQKEHLERLIDFARKLQSGGNSMSFQAFDRKKQAEYAQRAKEYWGNTEAYRVFSEKQKDITPEVNQAQGRQLMELLGAFGAMQNGQPEDPVVQAQVERVQSFISEHYYPCTNKILAQLGEMYGDGGEFTDHINAVGGAGAAEFASAAIKVYCAQK